MEQRNCENCIYYIQHYIKRPFSFHKINCGHCVKRSATYKLKNIACEFYIEKDAEQEKQQQIKTICQYLENIDKRLKKIKEALK